MKSAKKPKLWKNAKFWLIFALVLCLTSAVFASTVSSSFGRVKVSELRLIDRSGYEVSTLLYKPDNASEKNPAPCIITVEGWYNNKEMQDLYSVEYARRGYVVMAVDMHGHGDSESTNAEDLYTSAVGLDAAVELAGTLPYVDRSKIAVTGHSSGGAACNMAIAIDNQREVPLISAVLYQASTWVDDTGKDHSADLEGRNVGIIADKYDEFFYWTKDEKGNDTVPMQFLTTPDARNFINFNKGYDGVANVTDGKYYEKDGFFRVIFQPACTHPWVHFSAECVAYGIDFFEKALGAPNPLPPANQIWQWKTAFNFLGLVGIAVFVLSFMLVMLKTDYFSILKAPKEPEPIPVSGSKAHLWFWLPLVLCAVFSGVSYFWAISNIYSKTTAFFTQTGPLTIGVWSGLSGIFCLALLFIYYYSYGRKHGFNLKERGVSISAVKLWRTILLALLTVCLAMVILFTADYFFKSDFRIWVLTLKAFEADKAVMALKYMPMFLLFYIINSVSINCFNYTSVGKKMNILILSLFNCLGALVFVAIQYIPFFSGGTPMWYSTEGFRISGIWLYPAIVYLFITPFMTRFIYKKTNNPYLCAIVNAALITIMCVANTTTVLGGGSVVAANY